VNTSSWFLLRVFLCHSSGDKTEVRKLYRRLVEDGADPWLDEAKLLPGQDWHYEIARAVRSSNVVIVCLSHSAITKEGFVQKEIRYALDAADEKPEGTIFVIPLRLEECEVPDRLRRWQWVDLFGAGGYESLVRALRNRVDGINRKGPVPNLVSIPDVARLLSVSKTTVYRWIQTGTLRGLRVASKILVPKDALEVFRDRMDGDNKRPRIPPC
jgi:excisionase family DNA binding protein